MDANAPIAVVAALPVELSGARRAIRSRKELVMGPLRAWVGIADAPGHPPRTAIAAALGMGQRAVEEALERLVAEFSPAAIALVGLAGGCTAEASAGSAWLCDPLLIEPEMGPNGTPIADRQPIVADAMMSVVARRAAGKAAVPLRAGPSVTVNVIATARAKDSLGRNRGAAVCEMENFFAARFCAARGIPFAAVRVVFDGVADALPVVAGLGTEPLLRVLARKPAAALALPRLGWRMMQVRRVLDPLAGALVREMAAGSISDRA